MFKKNFVVKNVKVIFVAGLFEEWATCDGEDQTPEQVESWKKAYYTEIKEEMKNYFEQAEIEIAEESGGYKTQYEIEFEEVTVDSSYYDFYTFEWDILDDITNSIEGCIYKVTDNGKFWEV